MSADALHLLDSEQERQHLIEEFVADHGADWAAKYEPGTFGCHELLDRAGLLAELLERQILTHPACVQNEEWFKLAERAVDLINELYQRVGAAHLSVKDQQANGGSHE
jgi:hypothetical protein